MIVKVQRALYSEEPGDPPALIYDRHRRWTWMVPMPEAKADRMLGSDLKGYFEARISRQGNLVLGKRVADQDW